LSASTSALFNSIGASVQLRLVRQPDDAEDYPGGISEEAYARFFRLLREKTQLLWPALWSSAGANESPHRTNERVKNVVRKMRGYLRLFWIETDPRIRDWYIHGAREYYQRLFVLPQTTETRQEFENATTADDARNWAARLNIEIETLLDGPPQRNWVKMRSSNCRSARGTRVKPRFIAKTLIA
jgi:hypothetical protein